MRKTKEVTIEIEGRDKGRKFLLTELSSTQAEAWAARAFLALLASGVEIPEDVAAMGLAGLATVGIKALGGISWDLAKPLLEEMMTCVQAVMPAITRPLVEDDIEEVSTRLFLRKELLELHLGFSLAAKLSTSTASAAVKKGSPTT